MLLEQKVSTTPKANREVFGAMPRSRIALETGMHSPWVSRLLSELGHEVIVAHARNVRLIGESRKKDDRLDAQTLARLARIDPQLLCPVKHRSAKAQADLTVIRARAGLVRARTALVNTARGLAKTYGERLRGCNVRNMNPEKAEGSEPGTAKGAGAVAGRNRVAERTHPRVQRTDRKAGAGKLSAGGAAETDQRSGHADRADVPADAGRCASLSQEPRRGLLPGICSQDGETPGRASRRCTSAKKGDPYLRTLLVQGAHHILGPFGADSDLRRWGLKLAERGGKNGKKRAIIATARKLAVLLHRLWVSGEVYEPLRNSHQVAMPAAA